MTPQSIAEIPNSAGFLILMANKCALRRFLPVDTYPSLFNTPEGKELRPGPQKGAPSRSGARCLPVLGRKNHRPKLGVGLVELEGHSEIIFGGIVHTDHATVLLHAILRVDEQHRLAHMQFHFHLHQSAVGIYNLRQSFDLLAFPCGVFGRHSEAHAKHHAFAAAAVYRIGRSSHDLRSFFSCLALGGRTSQERLIKLPRDRLKLTIQLSNWNLTLDRDAEFPGGARMFRTWHPSKRKAIMLEGKY